MSDLRILSLNVISLIGNRLAFTDWVCLTNDVWCFTSQLNVFGLNQSLLLSMMSLDSLVQCQRISTILKGMAGELLAQTG